MLLSVLAAFAAVALFLFLAGPRLFRGSAGTLAKPGVAAALVGLLALGGWGPLSVLILAPVVLNIFAFHLFLERSGLPLAVLENNKVRFLREVEPDVQWQLQQVLQQREFPSRLRAYIGT